MMTTLVQRLNLASPPGLAALALLLGALFLAHPRPEPAAQAGRAGPWTTICSGRCELQTVAYDSGSVWQWVRLVYVPERAAFAVSSFRRAFAAAVEFEDGRRFVFDDCRDDRCWLPPAASASLLQRLQDSDGGALRVLGAFVGTTGRIDLPRLDRRVAARVAGGPASL